jgi:hypothetical protein
MSDSLAPMKKEAVVRLFFCVGFNKGWICFVRTGYGWLGTKRFSQEPIWADIFSVCELVG